MNLYINSPAYYTQKYGVIDDVYQLCKVISDNIDITLYTDALDTIGITPIIIPLQNIEQFGWKEDKHISVKFRFANISLISDYDMFINGNLTQKKQIILENIFGSLLIVKKKLKNRFNYEKIREDIIELVRTETGDGLIDS